jgi:uncharacterized protein YbaR (Trm112 family)
VIDPELLKMVLCPETRMPLREADAALVARLNEGIAGGRVKNRAGRPVETPLDGGLIREDGAVVYPVIDGIPVLLIDEAIPLEAAQHA